MKYEEFMKIVDKWSDNDVVCFLMEYPDWNTSILEHILNEWQEADDYAIEVEEIAHFARCNHIVKYTNLPEEEE
tara:strand:+ start:875 stop:1096 length:222 start_codon:yes stop_codon:yes gene_type:complete